MTSKHRYVAILSFAVLLGACTTGGSSGSVPPSVPLGVVPPPVSGVVPPASASTAPSTGPTASPGASEGAKPTPGSIDPCTLLTQAEASTLMGKPLGAGVSTTLDPDRVCTFKSGLSEVKVFLTPPAPDVATADAYFDAALAQFDSKVTVKKLSMFDRSAYGSGEAAGVSVSGFFVVDGTNGFEVYCGFPSCSETASAGAATLIAGRLP